MINFSKSKLPFYSYYLKLTASCLLLSEQNGIICTFNNQLEPLMKKFLFAFFTLLIHFGSDAQNKEWTVKSGESIKEVLGDSIIFRYPQFTLGWVYFKDGNSSNARLNLNLVNGEMQFIAPAGDTMTVSNENTIKYITIKEDTFYFDKVYLESVYANAKVKLAKMQLFKSGDIQKMGGYDQPSSVSSINNSSYFYNGSQVAKLTERTLLKLHKATIYFIGDRFNNFLPAHKKNIIRMFSGKKTAIETFMKENKIMLTKEADLIKLTDFLEKA